MTVDVDIVEAGPEDVDALFDVYREVAESGGVAPESDAPLRDVFIEGWVRRRRVYAARIGGETVGGYFLRTNFPAFAAHVAQGGYLVARAARGRGVGTRLLEHSIQEARRVGYRAIVFNLVLADNPSRRLYERAGFRVVGSIPQIRGEVPGLIYWRSLVEGAS